jgi:hypothetical protein
VLSLLPRGRVATASSCRPDTDAKHLQGLFPPRPDDDRGVRPIKHCMGLVELSQGMERNAHVSRLLAQTFSQALCKPGCRNV